MTTRSFLPYDPGRLPSHPAPVAGESIEFHVAGWPPVKERSRSIRNPRHPLYDRFVTLRTAASLAMFGRAWYRASVRLDLEVECPAEARSRLITDFMSGIMDTVGDSHGSTFTYLPILFEDDCQVDKLSCSYLESPDIGYRVKCIFM